MTVETAQNLGMHRLSDSELLARLARFDYEWVLVTGDDRMPFVHSDVVSQYHPTIATVDGEWERICTALGRGLSQAQFQHETVHRWAHVISEQGAGEVRRYSPRSGQLWRPRAKYGSLT